MTNLASDIEEKERLVSVNQEKLKPIENEHIMVEIQWSIRNRHGIRSRTKIKPHVKRTFSEIDKFYNPNKGTIDERFVDGLNKGTIDEIINQSTGNGCINHGNWISWLWLIIISFCATLMIMGRIQSPNDYGYWLLLFPISITWILYAFEWNFITDTPDYLALMESKENVMKYLNKLKTIQKAVIVWKSKCFYFEEGHRKKIITHEQETKISFHATDSSVACELNEFELTKLKLFKTWDFADDETKKEYYKQFYAFCNDNVHEQNDGTLEYQHVDVVLEMENFQTKLLVNGSKGIQSKCWNVIVYRIVSWVFCSPCYRTIYNCKSGVKSHIIQKKISLPMEEISVEENTIDDKWVDL